VNLRRYVATSDRLPAVVARKLYRAIRNFSVPAPRILVVPALHIFLLIRDVYYFVWRVFVCEPLFKAYCTEYGRNLHTGVFIHWVQGKGEIIAGDNVLVDGKCSFSFAARYTETPTLSIGSHTVISHGCSLTVGRGVSIGEHCLIASGVLIFDAPGHPRDPVLRKRGEPANAEDVRLIKIEDNVWIGRDSIIFPGVTIGEGSIVVTGSLVMSDVPPYTTVAGNPARAISRLSKEQPGERKENAVVMDNSRRS
jgi:acetyltransferase-like isoleucine patch superfamily enzyme